MTFFTCSMSQVHRQYKINFTLENSDQFEYVLWVDKCLEKNLPPVLYYLPIKEQDVPLTNNALEK